jgi:hypothetical protein
MHHWIDDLSDREENRAAEPQALARIAFTRAKARIEECLAIYNKRHPKFQPLQSESTDDGRLMTVALGKYSARVGFQFRAGSPKVARYRLSEREYVTDHGELNIEPGNGRIRLTFNGTSRLLENVVRETLQPVLFPGIPLTEEDGVTEYYMLIG